MGSNNSTCLNEILTVLHQSECNQMHPIWQKISVDSFCSIPDDMFVIRSLMEIKTRQPKNFSMLIFFIVDSFSKSVKLSEKQKRSSNFIQFCNFLQLLMTVSGDDPQWFKNGNGVLSQSKSISVLIEVLFELIHFNHDKANYILSNLTENIKYAITLLYISNAAAFNVKEVKDDPSLFIKAFDIIDPKEYLNVLLNFIIKCFHNKKIQEKVVYLIKAHLTFILPLTYSCDKWKDEIRSLDNSLVYDLFSLMILHNSYTNESIEQLITLLYIVILIKKDFIDFLEDNGKFSIFIISLLIYFQYQLDKKMVTYLHTIILILLSIFTSKTSALLQLNEPINMNIPKTRTKIFSKTIGDLLIEVLTNIMNVDLEMSAPIIPLVVGVLTNICSTTVNISRFSSTRLYDFLKFFFSSKISDNKDFIPIIDKLIIIIFNLTRIQMLGNHNLLIDGLEELINLNMISETEEWKSSTEKLIKVLLAVETPLNQSTSEEEKKIEVHNELSKILKTFEDFPYPKQSEIKINESMQTIWYDWFRILFYELIPSDASRYNLCFASFSIHDKNETNIYAEPSSAPPIKDPSSDEIEIDDTNIINTLSNQDDNLSDEPLVVAPIEEKEIHEFKNQTEPTDKPFGEYNDFLEFLNSG